MTVYVMMGVSGCGKTTVGQALAARLGCPFYILFVHLQGSYAELWPRLQRRRGHYMGPNMLSGQLAALEPPAAAEALILPAALPVQEIVSQIISRR